LSRAQQRVVHLLAMHLLIPAQMTPWKGEKKVAIGSNLLNYLSTESWMILPSVLQSYEKVLTDKFLDGKNFSKLASTISEQFSSEVDDGVYTIGSKAVINLEGTLLRKAGYLDAMCGVKGMNILSQSFSNIADDPRVDHIIMCIDSPGGSAIGTPEFAELVYNSRTKKRITALVTGQMCSGAFFIGSAAHEIYSTSSINDIGSIGVVMCHVDQSAQDSADGLKFSYVYAGKHKINGEPHSALSPEARAEFQSSVDYTYSIFKEAISKYRGVSLEEVEKFADGKVFAAGQVIGTVLLDGITTLDEVLRS
jgi:capsid assembly protease